MPEIWSDATVSVVLLMGGERGRDLLDLARDWTRQGMLDPAIWVHPDQVDSTENGPPRVSATIILPNGDGQVLVREVDLFETLARQSLKLVRLIKVRLAEPDREGDATQDQVADIVARYVGWSMPLVNPANSGAAQQTELNKISLICAPTQSQIDARVNAAVQDSNVVVVASPEDRSTPNAGDAFVRDNARFLGFVLMHLATVAGLWRGVRAGSLELFEREGSAAQSIWIQRVFISGILTGGLSRRTVAEVLSDVVGGHGAVAAGGAQVTPSDTAVIPVSQSAVYIDQMVEEGMSLDDHALTFRVPDVAQPPERRRVSIGEQLGAFARFGSGKLGSIPHWIGLWFHDLVSRSLSKNLQGEDGYRVVELLLDQDPDSHDRELLLAVQRIQNSDPGLRKSSVAGAPPYAGSRVTPRLWAGLRQLVFSAVDGSAAPTGLGFAPIENRAPVFGSLSDVAPDPDDRWVYPASPRPAGFPESVGWVDARTMPEIRGKLVDLADKAEGRRAEQEQKCQAQLQVRDKLAQEANDLRDQLLDDGLLRYRSDGRIAPTKLAKPQNESPDAAKAGGPAAVARWRSLEGKKVAAEGGLIVLEDRLGKETVLAQKAVGVLAEFDRWAAQHQRTFAYRMLDNMQSAQADAREQLHHAETGIPELPAAGELVRLRKRFHRGILIAFVVVALLTTFFALLPQIAHTIAKGNGASAAKLAELDQELKSQYPSWWVVVLIGVGVFVIIVLALLVAYYRRWSQFARKVELIVHDIETRFDRIRALRGEVQRLQSTHEQAAEWLDTLTVAMYHPWAVDEEWTTDEPDPVDLARTPFAMHLARTVESSGTGSDRVKREAAQRLFTSGWRADAFTDLVDEIGIRMGLDHDRFGVDVLDADIPDAPNNAKKVLRQNLGQRDVLEEIAARRLSAITSELQREGMYGKGTFVRPLEDSSSFDVVARSNPLTWTDFLSLTIREASRIPTPLSLLGIAKPQWQRAHHEEVLSYVLAPEAIVEALDPADRDGLHARAVPSRNGGSFDAVVRVDVAGPVPWEAIDVFVGDGTSRATSGPVTGPLTLPGEDRGI